MGVRGPGGGELLVTGEEMEAAGKTLGKALSRQMY
jgi:hypothetical protein